MNMMMWLRKRFSSDIYVVQRAPWQRNQVGYNLLMLVLTVATASSLITIVALKGK